MLTVTSAGIRRVSSFGDPSLVTVFGFRPDVAQAMAAGSTDEVTIDFTG